MDIDNLKSAWQSLSIQSPDTAFDSRAIGRRMAKVNPGGTQRRLADFYIKSGIFSLCVIALAPMIYTMINFPIWVAAVYGLFGLILAILNFSFSRYVLKYDYISAPVVTSLSRVIELRKRQRYLRIFGIICGICVLASLFAYAVAPDNEPILYGMLFGLAIGIPAGIVRWRKEFEITRRMQQEVRSLLNGEECDDDNHGLDSF